MQRSITSGQKKQVVRFSSDSVEKALLETQLDKDAAQRVIERGDEFGAIMRSAALEALKKLSVFGQYSSEEVQSNWSYPPEYKLKPIAEQVKLLRDFFPHLDSVDLTIAEQKLPEGAEGWFAIPRWEKIAPSYHEAVVKMLALIGGSRKFYNYREGRLSERHVRQIERTIVKMKALAETQNGNDIFIIPAQFGLRHRGRSTRRAREVFTKNEFGLGVFACGAMLLTHPERLVRWEQIHLDCSGDEYSPDADGSFPRSLCFRWSGGQVEFVSYWSSCVSARSLGRRLVSFRSLELCSLEFLDLLNFDDWSLSPNFPSGIHIWMPLFLFAFFNFDILMMGLGSCTAVYGSPSPNSLSKKRE